MHVLTTAAPPAELAAAASALVVAADRLPAGEQVTFEVYTWEDGRRRAAVGRRPWPRPWPPAVAAHPERVVVP